MSYAYNKAKKEWQTKPKKGHRGAQVDPESRYIDKHGHYSRSGLIGPVK